jgi:hypothetical protein
MKRATNAPVLLITALVAVAMAAAGCAAGDQSGQELSQSSPQATGTPPGPSAGPDADGGSGDSGSGSGGSGSGGSGDSGGSGGSGGGNGPPPSPDTGDGGGGTPEPPGGSADLEQVLLLPVNLLAPVECFTEGLSERYVDGYGAQLVDPRPHGEVVATRVEHKGLTRLQLDQTTRVARLLPGSGRPVEAPAGDWTVAVEVHMFLSGGFQLDYSRAHRGQTGQFRQRFTSPVDDTCVVELVYGITAATG